MQNSKVKIEEFIKRFDNFPEWEKSEQTDYIAYYLTEVKGEQSVTANDIQACFEILDIKEYGRLSPYLSENASSFSGKFVKKEKGYRLERGRCDEIKRKAENEPEKIEVSEQLGKLAFQIEDSQEKNFLSEALNCYKAQAFRAFVIMVWILTIDHLKRHIFKEKLDEFNSALSKNPDKRVKKILKLDDFGDLRESKFIELTRSARIISNDVRKILAEKLGKRDSAAHPSGVEITGHTATEFALDLMKNVLLKY